MILAVAREPELPDALVDRLAGAAVLAGVEASEVAAVLEGGPHTTHRAVDLAGLLLLVASGYADGATADDGGGA